MINLRERDESNGSEPPNDWWFINTNERSNRDKVAEFMRVHHPNLDSLQRENQCCRKDLVYAEERRLMWRYFYIPVFAD